LDVTESIWDNIHDINSKGLFFICQAIAQHWIRDNKKGKIINIASNRGILGDKAPYGMSKWEVICLTRGLGKELFPKGIIVNGIAPGIVSSGINDIDPTENAFINNPPSDRVGLPEEIAELAVFLASEAANHIVGQTIVCDGGSSLN
jgi:NAD(P)-dependent dehydrogenase (short-subunit alcohol dehydrogenase family)